jgi:cytochrome c peroxidase
MNNIANYDRKKFVVRSILRLAGSRVLPGLCALSVILAIPTVSASANGFLTRSDAKAKFRRPANIPFPASNPYSEAKAKLGEMLFFDPILSGSGTRSCATCHNPSLSWGDGLPRAVGENQKSLPLRSPTLLNIAWIRLPGWFGKFPDLESVAFTPMLSPKLMNVKEEDLIRNLSSIPGYRKLFAAAFPDGEINRRNIELAIATFQRTIVSGIAPFDRWIEGDEAAISEEAKRGFDLFRGKAGCAECHTGWNFTDGAFYDIGTAVKDDIGRAKLFPKSTKLRYAFKTPTLRDVSRRGPYMHAGSEPTLEAVMDLYDKGGINRPSRSELIKPLKLTNQEKADIIAFMNTLTSEPTPVSIPAVPR